MRFTVVYFIIARWTRDMYTTEICLRKYKTHRIRKKRNIKRIETLENVSRIRRFRIPFPLEKKTDSSQVTPLYYLLKRGRIRRNISKIGWISQRNIWISSWKTWCTSMRDPPSELMNSFALCTPEPTRIDSISFSERRDTRSARWIAITERFTIDDTTRTDFSCVRAGLCTGNTGLAGPCPFVTVSMHFGGRASLQLSHGLTSAHLHSRRRSYIYVYISRHGHPPGSPFPSRLHPRRNIPPRERPRVRREDEGEGRFGTRGAIHHPPLAGTENPFTDPTGTTGRECARAF